MILNLLNSQIFNKNIKTKLPGFGPSAPNTDQKTTFCSSRILNQILGKKSEDNSGPIDLEEIDINRVATLSTRILSTPKYTTPPSSSPPPAIPVQPNNLPIHLDLFLPKQQHPINKTAALNPSELTQRLIQSLPKKSTQTTLQIKNNELIKTLNREQTINVLENKEIHLSFTDENKNTLTKQNIIQMLTNTGNRFELNCTIQNSQVTSIRLIINDKIYTATPPKKKLLEQGEDNAEERSEILDLEDFDNSSNSLNHIPPKSPVTKNSDKNIIENITQTNIEEKIKELNKREKILTTIEELYLLRKKASFFSSRYHENDNQKKCKNLIRQIAKEINSETKNITGITPEEIEEIEKLLAENSIRKISEKIEKLLTRLNVEHAPLEKSGFSLNPFACCMG